MKKNKKKPSTQELMDEWIAIKGNKVKTIANGESGIKPLTCKEIVTRSYENRKKDKKSRA